MPDPEQQVDARQRGAELRARIGKLGAPDAEEDLAQLDPSLPGYFQCFYFGEILARRGLDLRTRMLCAVASFMVTGEVFALESAMHGALDVGAQRVEIVEVVLQTGCFAGFPKWTIGAQVGRQVFKARGIPEPDGALDPGHWDRQDLLRRGAAVRDAIFGLPRGTVSEQGLFDSQLPRYVLEFRFGAISSRPGLDLRTRQLCTLAAFLATGEEFAVESSMRGALNVGATRAEIVEVVLQTGPFCGLPRWTLGSRVALRVFRERGL